jgi:RNase adapter protein RapZ
MQLIVITGMSGSGKSVALHALEDAGFYCVDNLPPELLRDFVAVERTHQAQQVAVAMDVRSASSLPALPAALRTLQQDGLALTTVFLDAATDTLVRRYSETRRLHPLSLANTPDRRRALVDAIELERDLLGDLRDRALVLDTSNLRAAQLRQQVRQLLTLRPAPLTLVFESFGFKRGVPLDADYVFDVRMLPNPHYEPALRPLSGLDAPVAEFLRQHAEVDEMRRHIGDFLRVWLPRLQQDHRSYVTVAIGCTGGQHRSVYLAELLAREFQADWTLSVRHREAEHWGPAASPPGH